MKKPRCIHCNTATKRVYERKGSKAQFNGISRWWYCASCMKMQLGPCLPSENREEYSHPDAAKIYPKISKILHENIDKSGYHHINELNARIQNSEYSDSIGEINFRMQKFYDDKVYIKPLKVELQGYWICEVCDDRQPVEATESRIRMHCDKEMQIKVEEKITFDGFVEKIEEKLISSYSKFIEKQDFEKAGELLLEIVLHNLYHKIGYELDNSTFHLFMVEAKQSKKELRQTWGFMTVIAILQAFDNSGGYLKQAIVMDNYFDVKVVMARILENSIEILTDIFGDIQLKFRDEPVKISKYRIIFNGIKQNINELKEFKKLVKEMNEKKAKIKLKVK